MRLGGYQILDFENKDLVNSPKINEMYQDIYDLCKTKKRKVISGLRINIKQYDDFETELAYEEGKYSFIKDGHTITITNQVISVK
jgi:hypothetical protein